jgi:hypothetical protein
VGDFFAVKTDIFDGDDDTSSDGRPISSPDALLGIAGVCLVVALLLLIPSGRGINALGYVLSAVIVPSVVILYRFVDRDRRRHSSYIRRPGRKAAALIVLVAAILVAVVQAIRFAQSKTLA